MLLKDGKKKRRLSNTSICYRIHGKEKRKKTWPARVEKKHEKEREAGKEKRRWRADRTSIVCRRRSEEEKKSLACYEGRDRRRPRVEFELSLSLCFRDSE